MKDLIDTEKCNLYIKKYKYMENGVGILKSRPIVSLCFLFSTKINVFCLMAWLDYFVYFHFYNAEKISSTQVSLVLKMHPEKF